MTAHHGPIASCPACGDTRPHTDDGRTWEAHQFHRTTTGPGWAVHVGPAHKVLPTLHLDGTTTVVDLGGSTDVALAAVLNDVPYVAVVNFDRSDWVDDTLIPAIECALT